MKTIISLISIATLAIPAAVYAEISGSGTPNAACANGLIGGTLKRMPASGVQDVALRLTDEDGEYVYVATTDPDGKYLFYGLCEGDYDLAIVSESVPAGLDLVDVSIDGEGDEDDDDGSFSLTESWEVELDSDDEQLTENDFTFEGDMPMARCQLNVDAGCAVASLPTEVYVCSKRVNELSMIWAGERDVRVVAYNGKTDDDVLADLDHVTPGDRVTVSGMIDPPDDVYWEVYEAGSDILIGESKFHLACDDEEMDGPGACGLSQGNGKDNKAERINDWLLDGLVDSSGEIVCAEPAYDDVCQFEPVRADCDLVDKVQVLTFIYTGGECAESAHHQPEKFKCEGVISSGEPLLVTPKDEDAFEVMPGDVFSIERDGSDMEFELSNSGGTQELKIHTSCSKPLAAGDVFGGLTLGAINGMGIISPVQYRYAVSNSGDADAGVVSVTDTATNETVAGEELAAQSSITLYRSSWVRDSLTSTVVASGSDAMGECSAGDVTTAMVDPLASCDIAEIERELHDKEIRWTLKTGADAMATVERVEISWPTEIAGKLKEALLDGDKFFDQDILTGEFVIDDRSIEGETKKRRIKRNENRTLKVKFDKEIEDTAADIGITVYFEEGCSVAW